MQETIDGAPGQDIGEEQEPKRDVPTLFVPPTIKVFSWEKTPADIATTWEEFWTSYEEFSEERWLKIQKALQERSTLDSRLARARIRTLNALIDALQKEMDTFSAQLEDWWTDQQLAFREESVTAARRLGLDIDDDNESNFADEVLKDVLERPGIEFVYDWPLFEIHNAIVQQWKGGEQHDNGTQGR